MRARNLAILAITALFVNYSVGNVNGQTTSGITIDKSSSVSKRNVSIRSANDSESSAINASTVKRPTDYWMAKIGSIEKDLMNIQAIVVKDEDVKETCEPANRESNKRYLMCGGSILNRNHVLTSATCIHDATHIRHNIRAPLAVVIAPLKPSIQVIAVKEYHIHPEHHTNPYSKLHFKHNVAILKLACRINTENFHKIELPRTPMVQTCSEESCLVAAFRKSGKTNNIMVQMVAPDIPYPNRRRKETSIQDMEFRRYGNTMDDVVVSGRSKRKLAEPPIFVGKYKSGKRSNEASTLINSRAEERIENSTADATSVPRKSKNVVSTGKTSLYDDVSKAPRGSVVGNETVRSLVVRSSGIHRTCAQTGSPIIINRTQAALVAVPCDTRQASSTWHYSDLFQSLGWIGEIVQDLQPVLAEWFNLNGTTEAPKPAHSGNHSGCSTCIFNFFIEIGCKDKNQCGKNYTGPNAPGLPGQEAPKPGTNVAIQTRRTNQQQKQQSCSSVGNGIGIEVGVGQGCEKTGKETGNRSGYVGKSGKSVNKEITEVEKEKPTSMFSTDGIKDIPQQREQSVTVDPIAVGIRDDIVEKDKFLKINSEISGTSQTDKPPVDANFHRDRATNEISSQTNDGETSEWVSEVEKGLELNTQVKRDLVKSRRLNI